MAKDLNYCIEYDRLISELDPYILARCHHHKQFCKTCDSRADISEPSEDQIEERNNLYVQE